VYRHDGINYFSRKKDLLPARPVADEMLAAVLRPEYPLVVVVHGEAGSQVRNEYEQALIEPLIRVLAAADGYGLDAEVIIDAAGRERLVTDDLLDLLDRLEPVARRLGCLEELGWVAQIPRTGASYQRQRRAAARHNGDLGAVVDSLVAELRSGRPDGQHGAG
jgi:hypothetical protein